MLNKGNLHSDGRELGFYLLHPSDNEKVWLHSARGFLADLEALPTLEGQRAALMDEFGALDAIAMDATRATKPFFHHYCRMPIAEDLNDRQWEWVADMIEARLGLQGQPRAIAFHVKDGYKHMHVAYSRIDPDLKAIDMPFFIDRMMAVSRELEREWGLEMLSSRRAPDRPRAPKRDEFEEARRLGISIEDARQFIRDCRDHADCGRAYVAALEEGGMILARGDRRPFVVVDQAGGLHSLDKSLLGITIPNIRKWLADLDHASLPTIDAARALQSERRARERDQGHVRGGEGGLPERASAAAPARYQALRDDHARAIEANRIQPEDYFDRDAAERAWDEGLIAAAIKHDAAARQLTPVVDQVTDRDPRYAHYRADKLAAKHVQLDLAAARYSQEAMRAVAGRQMALAREGDDVLLCSPRYKFKSDPLLQEKIRDLLGDDINALPGVKEAKRTAWIAERGIMLQRDVRVAFADSTTAPQPGKEFVRAMAARGHALERDQKQMIYVRTGQYRKLLTDLLDTDQQRALMPKIEDSTVLSQLEQFDNPRPRRTPEEQAEYARHEARAQEVMALLAQPAPDDRSLADALGNHGVALGYDGEKQQVYAVTERFRFALDQEQTDRALRLMNEDHHRQNPGTPALLADDLPEVKQAHGIARAFQRDNMIQRDVNEALAAVVQNRGGGVEFAVRLEAKDLELVSDYGNRLFVDTGKRRLALHDLVPLGEHTEHLQFAREDFKALRKFRSSIDVLEAHTERWNDLNAAREARANAFVMHQAQHVTGQTVQRVVFQGDRAKTMAGIGMSFVGRALGLFAGGITGLFADFGKYGQANEPTVARGVYAPTTEVEPEPGRLMRDRLGRHSALEIAQDVGLRSQALSNSGMIGDDKRLELQRRSRSRDR